MAARVGRLPAGAAAQAAACSHCTGHIRLEIDGALPLSVAAALIIHYARTSRSEALQQTPGGLNALGGDMTEEAVEELYAEYVNKKRGFKRARRKAAVKSRQWLES